MPLISLQSGHSVGFAICCHLLKCSYNTLCSSLLDLFVEVCFDCCVDICMNVDISLIRLNHTMGSQCLFFKVVNTLFISIL